ncbi:hypothetical protein [Paenibacillus pinistramenti]|uniref:hypothetical protein n=1 Tax=Paenibacillus pinistramenti TaxID=1768003 RepID=UPI00139692C4|nr:hypothetical protein [Paenibacillus pinistramenti]
MSPGFNWRGVNLIQIAESRSHNGDRLAQYCLSKLDDLLNGIDSFEPIQYVNHSSAGIQWLLLDSSPLRDPKGLVQGILISVHDISSLHTATAVSINRLSSSPISRLLPMCAVCKRIRDNQEDWHSLESYLKNHLQIEFTHDICTECIGQLYPQYASLVERKRGTHGL